MPIFHYKAVARGGEVVEGELDAVDQSQAIARLRATGHVPIRADLAGGAPMATAGWRRLAGKAASKRDIAAFTTQLATMISAGLDLNASLGVLADISEKADMRRLVLDIQGAVQRGSALSEALAERRAFSRLYVNMVKAGESVGKLDLVLERLSEYQQRSLELQDTVSNALIYPIILLLAAGSSMAILLIFVLPRFKEMFDTLGAPLPMATQLVIGFGELLSRYGLLLLIVAVGAVIWFRYRLRRPPFRRGFDEWLLKTPVLGGLLNSLQVARFCRTLGTLTDNGVPLIAALGIVREIITNQAIAAALPGVTERVKHGQGLAAPLAESGYFPRQAIQLIRVGEETGRLDEMLLKLGDIFDREVEVALKRLLSLLEPVLIIGFGVVIAFIIMSLLLAILGINDLPF
jgi:general secretion pathway protein F